MPLLALRSSGGFFHFFLLPVCGFGEAVGEGLGGRPPVHAAALVRALGVVVVEEGVEVPVTVEDGRQVGERQLLLICETQNPGIIGRAGKQRDRT